MTKPSLRPVWAQIDVGNFKKNLKAVASVLRPGAGILAVVKADAYGAGASVLAPAALTVRGVAGLAVATPDEALSLRKSGIQGLLLVLGPCDRDATYELIKEDVSLTVTSLDSLQAAEESGQALRKKAKIHIKVDTGMGRVGFLPGDELNICIEALSSSSATTLEGVFTHFATADCDENYFRRQWQAFQAAVQKIRAQGLNPRYIHAANSAAILSAPDTHLDLVRPGIIIYGSYPATHLATVVKIHPVFSLYARVSHVKVLPAGSVVGYGATYTCEKPTLVATVPIGYADGYPRALSNKGSVLINGKRCPVIGRVCMDQIMVDATGSAPVKPGDLVTLIGKDQTEEITVDEIAALCGTIPHEIMTGLSPRVPRVYVDTDQEGVGRRA